MPKIPNLPVRIEGLAELAMNLAWSWNPDARRLFRAINEPLWHQVRHNPLELLRRADPTAIAACASDPQYLQRYDAVLARFHRELHNGDRWFREQYPVEGQQTVAYFCAEFGLHSSVPIYSGGLGVLAGDHCKAASDLGLPLVGVGLFYRRGYFDQRLRLDGWQESSDDHFDVEATPLEPMPGPDGQPWLATVTALGRTVHLGAWRMMVGRVPVYLLDTDFDANHPDDRALVSKLYEGGPTHRIRQEWLLGVGGVRVLQALGVTPAVWHANEGHAAFMMLERLCERLRNGESLPDATGAVRRSSVFTTHTPVPAGHDFFSFDEVNACAGSEWDGLPIPRETLLRLGERPTEPGLFHMTIAAMRLASHVNGVSRQHGQVSRRLWHDLWPGRPVESVPIGHITNGVHLPTWMALPVTDLLNGVFGPGWHAAVDSVHMWGQLQQLEPRKLWVAHEQLKQVLFQLIREDARWRFKDQWREAAHVVGAGTLLEPNVLTIGFARRFATYKRADLLFRDVERLQRLVTNPSRPMQIVFAGKAHPADEPGKAVLQRVYQFTRDPAFEGRIAFLEDYDMHLAHLLVQGVDLWVNVPRVPYEASGTSGMKAGLNGVPQIGTLDGWWHEGFDGLAGWALPPAPDGSDDDANDAHDAERLYSVLEEQVVPLFYARDEDNVPIGWVEKMRHAMRLAGSRFTARRMVQDYARTYYVPAMRGDSAGDDPPVT
jgi:starch phosphorylase